MASTIGTTKGHAAGAKRSYKKAAMHAKTAKQAKGFDKYESTTISRKYESKGDASMKAAGRNFDGRLRAKFSNKKKKK